MFIRRLTVAVLLAGLGTAVWLYRGGALEIPARYDPWARLDLAAAPNLLTRFKLSRLEDDAGACRAVLAASSLRFSALPDRVSAEGCAVRDAVRVTGSGLGFSSPFTATCPVAAAWMLFETHALQPAAERHFGQRVTRVLHLGSYACRTIYGRPGARPSEHASANAVDIAGFMLADGTAVSLVRDWSDSDVPAAAFLRDVRDGACRFFDVVLGPAYNAAHRDHFHLDMGPFHACR